MTSSQIMKVHESSGHPGIRCTAYFARWICPTITKADVRSAIRAYWQRLGIDITHYNGKHFLTVTDCGPTTFYYLVAVAATGF